jgi:hypothetical protein
VAAGEGARRGRRQGGTVRSAAGDVEARSGGGQRHGAVVAWRSSYREIRLVDV